MLQLHRQAAKSVAHKQKAPTQPPVIVIEPKEMFGRVWSSAPSLKPGLPMMEAAAEHQPEACAIRDAWQFRHPVTVLSRDAYAELIDRCSGIVFAEGK